MQEIIEKCNFKLDNGLTSVDDMIKLVKDSNEKEIEKNKIIDYLLGKEQKKVKSTKESCSYYYKQVI